MRPRPVECAFGFCVHLSPSFCCWRSSIDLGSTWKISWLVRLPSSKPTSQCVGGGGVGGGVGKPSFAAAWMNFDCFVCRVARSPGPGTGNAGDGHDAATFLHHHVNVGPHDLGDLTHLKSKSRLVHASPSYVICEFTVCVSNCWQARPCG